MKQKWLIALLGILFGVLLWRVTLEYSRVGSQTINSWTDNQSADCAVVLTGGPYRVREGFDLLAQKSVKKLIISGVYPKAQLREIFPLWPFYGYLKREDVILEKRSTTTYGNAQQSLPLIEALYCRDLLLVTSDIHMYRAYKIFSSVLPKGFTVHARAVPAGFSPTAFSDRMIETMKSLFYSLWAY